MSGKPTKMADRAPNKMQTRGLIWSVAGHRDRGERRRDNHRTCGGDNSKKMHDSLLLRVNMCTRGDSAQKLWANMQMTRGNDDAVDVLTLATSTGVGMRCRLEPLRHRTGLVVELVR